MKLATLALVAALAGCGGAETKVVGDSLPPAASTPLRSLEVMDTKPWACDHRTNEWRWSNPTGKPLKVVLIRQWVGLDSTLESDTHVESWITQGGQKTMMLTLQQLDNYKQRSFEQERWVSYAPYYMEIPADGGIYISGRCHPITGGNNAHVLVQIWYLL